MKKKKKLPEQEPATLLSRGDLVFVRNFGIYIILSYPYSIIKSSGGHLEHTVLHECVCLPITQNYKSTWHFIEVSFHDLSVREDVKVIKANVSA